MERSLFIQYAEKFFAPIISAITEKWNGKKREEQLLYKQMLTPDYSSDLKFGADKINHSIVAADVVSMDSSLPLKKRDSFQRVYGDIPKLGLKFVKREKEITEINTMIARGVKQAQIAAKIFDDVAKCMKGIDVRKEIIFLQGISTGVAIADSDNNKGIGIRVDYGYKEENFLRAKKRWNTNGETPVDDLEEVFAKAEADGNQINVVMMSKKYYDYFKKSDQGKVLAANYSGYNFSSVANLGIPANTVFQSAFKDHFGADLIIVNSSFRVEKDGVLTTVRPFEEANIVCLPDRNVGRLVYGTLAEETNPVNGVVYQSAGEGTLISKYSKNDPLEEFTAGQALAIPVIDNGDQIYVMQAGVDALGFSPDKLTFTSAADTTGKKVVVTTDAESLSSVSVPTGGSWATVTFSGKEVLVKVSANTATGATDRVTTVTVTDSLGQTGTFTVTQED